jgi:hypothetical protein
MLHVHAAFSLRVGFSSKNKLTKCFARTRKKWELLRYFYLWDSRKASLAMKFFSRVLQKSRENFGFEQVSLFAKTLKRISCQPYCSSAQWGAVSTCAVVGHI